MNKYVHNLLAFILCLQSAYARQTIHSKDNNVSFILPNLIKWQYGNRGGGSWPSFWYDHMCEKYPEFGTKHLDSCVDLYVELQGGEIFVRNYIFTPCFSASGQFRYFKTVFDSAPIYRVHYIFENDGSHYVLACYENSEKYPDYRDQFDAIANSAKFDHPDDPDFGPWQRSISPHGQYFVLKDYRVGITLPNFVDWKPSYKVYERVNHYVFCDIEGEDNAPSDIHPNFSFHFQRAAKYIDLAYYCEDFVYKDSTIFCCKSYSDISSDSTKYTTAYYYTYHGHIYELSVFANPKKYPHCSEQIEKIARSVKFDVALLKN